MRSSIIIHSFANCTFATMKFHAYTTHFWIRFHHPREKRIGWITKEKQRNTSDTNMFWFVGQWSPCFALDVNIWISQYTRIISTPWPSNVDIYEMIVMIDKCLHYNWVVLLLVPVVQRICNYFNVSHIAHCTLRKLPTLKESIHNNLQIFLLVPFAHSVVQEFWQLHCTLDEQCNRLWEAHTKQVAQGTVFNIGSQSPQSDSNSLFHTNRTSQEIWRYVDQAAIR